MAPTAMARYGTNTETPEALMLLNVQPKLCALLEYYRILTSNNYGKHCLNELTQSHSKQTDTNQVNADAKPTHGRTNQCGRTSPHHFRLS